MVVQGQDGDDTLTIDYSNGNPLPAGGSSYDGGAPTTAPGDALVVTGGNFANVVYDARGGGSGDLTLDGRTITFTGLKPMDLSGSTVADLTINVDDTNTVAGTVATTVANHGDFDAQLRISSNDSGDTATWTFTGLPAGTYEVAATWKDEWNSATGGHARAGTRVGLRRPRPADSRRAHHGRPPGHGREPRESPVRRGELAGRGSDPAVLGPLAVSRPADAGRLVRPVGVA